MIFVTVYGRRNGIPRFCKWEEGLIIIVHEM